MKETDYDSMNFRKAKSIERMNTTKKQVSQENKAAKNRISSEKSKLETIIQKNGRESKY